MAALRVHALWALAVLATAAVLCGPATAQPGGAGSQQPPQSYDDLTEDQKAEVGPGRSANQSFRSYSALVISN